MIHLKWFIRIGLVVVAIALSLVINSCQNQDNTTQQSPLTKDPVQQPTQDQSGDSSGASSYGFSKENLEALSNLPVALPVPNTSQVIYITGNQFHPNRCTNY